MDTTTLTTWPYEHRFECCVRGSLLAVPPVLWSSAVALMGGSIRAQGKTPSCHYYLLNTGFLIVFDRRCVLVSSVVSGLAETSSYILGALSEKEPFHATLTRRYPVGEELLSLAVAGLDESQLPPIAARLEAGTIHEWTLQAGPNEHPPQTLSLLFHGLIDSSDLTSARSLVATTFPDFLVATHQRSHDSFTAAAISGNQYIALQRTESVYASLEISVYDWHRAEELIGGALMLFRPEIVAPLWHGEPMNTAKGLSSNDDTFGTST